MKLRTGFETVQHNGKENEYDTDLHGGDATEN